MEVFMNEFDKQRIENAAWTLFQYQEDIENMATEMKLDRYEIEVMFKTLCYIQGTMSK
jgi:hypothetical protein